MRKKYDEKKSQHEERERRKLSEHCDDLKHEAEVLRSQLELVHTYIIRTQYTRLPNISYPVWHNN